MGWGGRWEGGSGCGTHVHPWWIHVNVWQNQYGIVKQNKVKKKKKKERKKRGSIRSGFLTKALRISNYLEGANFKITLLSQKFAF